MSCGDVGREPVPDLLVFALPCLNLSRDSFGMLRLDTKAEPIAFGQYPICDLHRGDYQRAVVGIGSQLITSNDHGFAPVRQLRAFEFGRAHSERRLLLKSATDEHGWNTA